MERFLPPKFVPVLEDVINSTDFIGYVACGLVLLTFCMQAMLPLRLVALVSNAAFITYSWTAKLLPIFLLHCLLAVINVVSLVKMVSVFLAGGHRLKDRPAPIESADEPRETVRPPRAV